jgi:drug/metabolite transporter (DMT)-like permease
VADRVALPERDPWLSPRRGAPVLKPGRRGGALPGLRSGTIEPLKPLDTTALVTLALVWGSAFLFTEVAVADVPPLTLVAGRFVLSGALLLAIAAWSRTPLPKGRTTWRGLALLAVMNNIGPFTLITWAQQHIESNIAAILNGSMPIFTAVIAAALALERLDRERTLGVVLGFAGIVALVGPDLRDITSSSALGQLAVVLASLGYGASTLYMRHGISGTPLGLATGQVVLSAVALTPIALAVDRPLDIRPSGEAWASWAVLGMVASGLAYVLAYWLIQRIEATQMAMVAYLIPVVATVIGWIALDERLSPNAFLGLALVLFGIAATNGALSAAIRRMGRSRAPVEV